MKNFNSSAHNPNKCGFTESEILSRRASQHDSDPTKIKVRCPNTAGHKNDDQNPSAIYNQDTGFLHCFVCGQLGFADDRDDPDYVRSRDSKRSKKKSRQSKLHEQYVAAERSLEELANDPLFQTLSDWYLRALDVAVNPESSAEVKLRDMFVSVNRDRYVFHHGDWYLCADSTGLWSVANSDAYRDMVLASRVLLHSIDDDEARRKLHNRIEHHHIFKAALEGASHFLASEGKNLEFDTHEHLLGVRSGVIDLQTGELRNAVPEEYVLTALNYDPDFASACSHFDDLMTHVCQNLGSGAVPWLWRLLGYHLTGSCKHALMLFVVGRPKTGKSTFLETLRYIFGAYGCAVDSKNLTLAKDAHSQWKARLKGKRLAVSSETRFRSQWNSSEWNDLISGQTVPARHMYGSEFDFRSQVKLVVGANHKPSFRKGDGMERRVRLVDCDVIPEPIDEDLIDKLQTERPAILARLIEQAGAWYREGLLAEPATVMESTYRYVSEQDTLQEFIDDECEVSEKFKQLFKMVFDRYRDWCIRNDLSRSLTLTKSGFKQELIRRGFEVEYETGGGRFLTVYGLDVLNHGKWEE